MISSRQWKLSLVAVFWFIWRKVTHTGETPDFGGIHKKYELRVSFNKSDYFLIRNSNENILTYLLLTRGKKNKCILIGIVYWASSSRLSSFVHHVVVDVKLGPLEKLFVLTIFNGFIGLCRVSIMQYMELLDKKLTGPGPEMSVHPGVIFILFFSFFVTFFLTENHEAACFTEEHST